MDIKKRINRYSIATLKLSNFRNYVSLKYNFNNNSTFIYGPNGSGKTNILESISLLFPGKGIRHTMLQDLCNFDARDWAINAEINNGMCHNKLAFGKQNGKYVVKINGLNRVRKNFVGFNNILWLSPQYDAVVSANNNTLRRFIDRLAYIFYPEHADYMIMYNKAKKQRSILLNIGKYDANWLSGLEKLMAKNAFYINSNRAYICSLINNVNSNETNPFMDILITQHLSVVNDSMDEQEFISKYRNILLINRNKDKLYKRTAFGIHLTSYKIKYLSKAHNAKFASTGEQKILMISIIFSIIKSQKETMFEIPIVLLDDILSHLDIENAFKLIEYLLEMKVQTLITATSVSNEIRDMIKSNMHMLNVCDL